MRCRCVAFALSMLVAGCAGTEVDRVVDGRVIAGRFVSDRAYAELLRGALAEDGPHADLEEALRHYRDAARDDPASPELWTRIGRLECARDPSSKAADADLRRALSLDRAYEPALAAVKGCDARRHGEPSAPPPPESAAATTGGDEARVRLEVATLAGESGAAAWEALARWGREHGQVEVEVRGLIGLVRRAPPRRFAAAERAVALAGNGHVVAARRLAIALLDEPGDRSSGGEGPPPTRLPLVPRLAIDDALLRGDLAEVQRVSSRAHLPVSVAAGRALVLGRRDAARDLVALTVRADPDDLEARLVHEAAAGRASARDVAGAAAPLDAEVALPFARDVLVGESAGAAHLVVAAGGGVRIDGGDAQLVPLAVDLAASGVIDDAALPAAARVELAARRGVVPDARDLADPSLDARHRLLGQALAAPAAPATRELARELASAGAEDLVVAVALTRVALGGGDAVSSPAKTLLQALAPADPLAAAAVVDLERQSGTPAGLRHARREMAALAKTAAERARATE